MVFDEKKSEGQLDDSDNGVQSGTCQEGSACEAEEVADAVEQQCEKNRDECTREMNELRDMCKSIAADFENFKKRVARDRVQWSFSAQAELLRDLLPIIDDFDRALTEYRKSEQSADFQAWISGFELIRKAFDKFLSAHGVTPIKEMTIFDPQYHEALAHVESPVHQPGQIVDIVHQGYMLNGQILRVALVTVAK